MFKNVTRLRDFQLDKYRKDYRNRLNIQKRSKRFNAKFTVLVSGPIELRCVDNESTGHLLVAPPDWLASISTCLPLARSIFHQSRDIFDFIHLMDA